MNKELRMKRKDIFPSRFFRAEDVDKPVRLTIERVEQELVGEDKELKTAVYGVGDPRGVVLNKTRYDAIASAYGEETNGWGGRIIEIYCGSTMYGGKRVPCVAVRIPPEEERYQ
jgi:hypothetical protein